MIRKLIIASGLFLLLGSFASAKVTELNYKATFGIFGTVGMIENTLTQNHKTYEIATKVTLAGLAKVLLSGQSDHYTSKGHMENGLMISDFYEMISQKKDKRTSKEYHIDHKGKYVTKRVRKWLKGKLVKDRTEKLKFYAKDDLLTLYFNLGTAVKKKGKTYISNAVGLEKQNGEVQITVPDDTQVAVYKKDLGEGADLYVKALIHQKNFRKKKGDILLAIAKDGFITKSVIKDILFYGDAKLIRVK
ncbi:MAG: DUF3108 domain-containing protein [Sulfurovum sp.]|nr:DUF3108 domain-containing protein [Sulfurovum sp.]